MKRLVSLVLLSIKVSHTLLRVLRHCIDAKNIESNLHLVYALVYHQSDFNVIASKKRKFSSDAKDSNISSHSLTFSFRDESLVACPFKESELACIQTVIRTAATLIQENADARTAPKAMAVLEKNMSVLKDAANKIPENRDDSGDFTFTYEEEADPEIFFIPYVWEVVVCVATASSIEWQTDNILAFALLEEEAQEEQAPVPTSGYSENASDMV